jgi:hypothetical protein
MELQLLEIECMVQKTIFTGEFVFTQPPSNSFIRLMMNLFDSNQNTTQRGTTD